MEELQAAIQKWECIAAFAWRSHELSGPGAVVVEARDLVAEEEPVLNYFAVGDIPGGDDFRPLIGQYDPAQQVVLMVGGDGQPERVYVLEADSRPTPPQCAASASPGS